MIATESQKTYIDKIANGFFVKYMSGHGLDIGYRGYNNADPILPNSLGIDLDYPGYDGIHLPFPDNSQDYVYSSHTLEHITDYQTSIKEWLRVTKKGGYIITVVPHQDLYERKEVLPSNWNGDHKRFYRSSTLLREFEVSLPINSYRIRHLRENDEGHDYSQPVTEHAKWLYEIELVIQKL